MREQADALGFTFSRLGCPCNGSPRVYVTKRGNKPYELFIWERRAMWKLIAAGTTIAYGKAEELKTKIQAIWDL